MKAFSTVGLIVIGLMLLQGCGGSDTGERAEPAHFLAEKFEAAGLDRVTPVRVFPDTALWEYINGAAEQYLRYDVREVATADYEGGDIELTLEIYQFNRAVDAFGLYSQQRPGNPTTVNYGIEGHASGALIRFVKGTFVVNVQGYDNAATTVSALRSVAEALAGELPGATALPPLFEQLPSANALAASETFYREGFPARPSLTGVYARRYELGADTITCFLTGDNPGPQLLQWGEEVSAGNRLEIVPPEIPFADGKAILTDASGRAVIAGIRGPYLVGIIGYTEDHEAFLKGWLERLP